MLSKKQILEIRKHLEKAQNPVFFYDNDCDGFCSYVLLRRFLGRGRGVAVKSHPDINPSYARKIQELNADYVFVLDRPLLGKDFVEEVESLNVPLVWIDHHETDEKYDSDLIHKFNPTEGRKKSNEPTTYLAYSVTNRREDMWIAMMGCIADHYIPSFASEFGKEYSQYWGKKVKEPFDVYFGTGIGRLIMALSFGIKDSVTHVIQLQNFMIEARSPEDFELELEGNKSFARKYRQILKKYNLLMDKAKKCADEKVLFFNYSGDLSISSDISNELSYLYPGRLIVVSYSSGPYTTLSMRGKNAKKLLDEILPFLEEATGGGHKEAVGSRMQTKDLERFKEELYKRI